MGLLDALKGLFGRKPAGNIYRPGPQRAAGRLDPNELARRLGLDVAQLENVPIRYHRFTVPKRRGGTRELASPEPALKELQRRILRRLLPRLKAHPAAHGFERGQSIVTNALPHTGKAIVVRMDIRDFFPRTRDKRVRKYFQGIGWNRAAAKLLTRLCTLDGGLPQGAPTSPRLSNLVNGRLDARLSRLAARLEADYTRYADDITFSFAQDARNAAAMAIAATGHIVSDFGYRLHTGKKLRIWRRHDRQMVTGLIVNDRVALPRRTRRKLRAAAHHVATGRPATLSAAQLDGWRALELMIARQSGQAPAAGAGAAS